MDNHFVQCVIRAIICYLFPPTVVRHTLPFKLMQVYINNEVPIIIVKSMTPS